MPAKKLILIAILLIAALLRLWQIDTLPPGFHFDESFEGLEAWRILTDPTYRPIFLTGNFGVPPLNAYANALTFGLFRLIGGEIGPMAMRITAACFGIIGVLALYGLATELRHLANQFKSIQLSPAFPIFAAATLAIMRWHIHFSRMGIEPIIVPLLWTATFWLLLKGHRTNQWQPFIGCGILLAACMYTYQAAWIIPLLTIPITLHLMFFHATSLRSSLSTIHYPLSTALVAILLITPLCWFFWQNPDLLLLRPQQLNIVGATGSPADSTLWGNLWATMKMFGPFGLPGDLDPRRNLPGAPAINIWLTIPFYLGLLITLWRFYQPAYAFILWGLVGLLAPGIFSEYAPHFHRILGAAAPVALFCGIGLDWIYQWSSKAKLSLRFIPLLILILAGTTSAHAYFIRWATQPALYHAFDVGLWDVGSWIAKQPADVPIYLTPRDANHATLAFAWQTRYPARPAPVTFDGRYIFPFNERINDDTEFYISLEQEDFRTRLLLPEVFPDAEIVHEFLDTDGNIDARVYARLPQTQAQRLPQVQWQAEIGDGIALLGYDVQPAQLQPSGILYLQLHWSVAEQPNQDWTV